MKELDLFANMKSDESSCVKNELKKALDRCSDPASLTYTQHCCVKKKESAP